MKPVAASGSYVAAPGAFPVNDNRLRVEACLVARDGATRLRVVATLMQHWESKQWQLQLADVHREQ